MMSGRPPIAKPKRYTWRTRKEIVTFYGIALVLSAWVYLWDGQAFVLWGTQTAAYYVGHTTTATVTATNVPGYEGVPSDDSEPTNGAKGVFVDDQGHSHTIFLPHATTQGQQADVSYLPFLPGLAVVRADFEDAPAVYFGFVVVSGGILWLYWHFLLRHLVALRDKAKTPAQGRFIDAATRSDSL